MHWITHGRVSSFIVQLGIATVGAILAGIVLVQGSAVLLAAFTANDSGGNFGDHVVQQRIFLLLDEPYFIAPILAGLTLGLFGRRVFCSDVSKWVWVVPAALLLVGVATWRNGGFRPYWQDVWNNYFGSKCGSSECLYEWLLTAPFYTSVAYTLGWIVENRRLLRAN